MLVFGGCNQNRGEALSEFVEIYELAIYDSRDAEDYRKDAVYYEKWLAIAYRIAMQEKSDLKKVWASQQSLSGLPLG